MGTDTAGAGGAGRALFVLSFRQRDELSATLARAGWQVVAARRSEGARQRLVASGAAVAIVDARGAADDGLSAVSAMASALAPADVLLVLVSARDVGRLDAFRAAGATQFLASPFGEAALLQAVRFAVHAVERMGGEWHEGRPGGGAALAWRYDPASHGVQIAPALANLLKVAEQGSAKARLRGMDRDCRHATLAAVRRLQGGGAATAFAHDVPGLGRVVQHLARDPHSNRLHALVEPLAQADGIGAAVRDALGPVRDASGAAAWVDRRLAQGRGMSVLVVSVLGLPPVPGAAAAVADDPLLAMAERRIVATARDRAPDAIAAKLHGATFAILLPGEDATAMAQALTAAFARPFVTERRITALTLRHAASAPQPGEAGTALLNRLDRMVSGTGQDGAPTSSADHRSLERDVMHAVARDELAVVFQPQVEMATGRIVGVEALARWHHGRAGSIGPERLFAAASTAGIGMRVSAAVQAMALRTAAAWSSPLTGLRVSINVTAEDVAAPGFVDALLDRADSAGFPRSRLTVEIVESGLIAELGEAARVLAELRAAGCRVAIDDFGTGYSSLAYLKALPLDYLKIDRRLSQDIVGSARDRVVVRGVIDMARSLGLTVIAEGVETEAQRDALAAEGCELYQGFLCAEPLEPNGLADLLA